MWSRLPMLMLLASRVVAAQASYSVEGKVKVEVEAPPATPPTAPAEPAPPPVASVQDGQIRIFSPVYFESRGETAVAPSLPSLDAVAWVMLSKPFLAVRIEAHTDNVASNNQSLSQRRADWVRAYLIKKGVAAERLEARGFGATRPITTNDTFEGRAQNRRVEFVLRPKD
jgi:outer membrane protein OmpA-like peptidoglycan-associated protein